MVDDPNADILMDFYQPDQDTVPEDEDIQTERVSYEQEDRDEEDGDADDDEEVVVVEQAMTTQRIKRNKTNSLIVIVIF